MSRSIHEYVVKALEGADLDEVHDATKIARSTLYKIMKRFIPNPGIKSIDTLYFHFRDREGRSLRRKAA